MKNDGDGTFTESSTAGGLAEANYANSAAWGDYDNDGRPDLALARFSLPAKLYRNNGNGTFTDVSEQSGLSSVVDAVNTIWVDYDNDGDLDLYVGGRLFRNNHDGTFTDVSLAAGVVAPATGGGAAWVDYDNDSYLDLYVTHWHTDPYLYHSNGNGTFTDVAVGSGLEPPFDYAGQAAVWGDADLDGRIDLFQVACFMAAANSRSLLYHNIGPAGNWLRVHVVTSGTGDATGSDPVRDAIGARVELDQDNDDTFPTDGHRTLTRLIGGGSGLYGQNEQVAHFGVGTSSVVCVRVRFPDGSVVTHRNVPVNQQITIRDVPADRTEEPFDDVPLDYWAFEQVEACVAADIVGGYEDGLYHGDWAVNRGQMAVFVSRGLAGGEENVPEPTADPGFTDVDSEHWAYKYICYVVDQNIVAGYPEGDYKPDQEVTRGQMAVYVARAMVAPTTSVLDTYEPPDPRNFPDVPSDYWAYPYVEYCVEHSIVSGYLDGTYRPDTVVTRDQMAVYVQRTFGLGD